MRVSNFKWWNPKFTQHKLPLQNKPRPVMDADNFVKVQSSKVQKLLSGLIIQECINSDQGQTQPEWKSGCEFDDNMGDIWMQGWLSQLWVGGGWNKKIIAAFENEISYPKMLDHHFPLQVGFTITPHPSKLAWLSPSSQSWLDYHPWLSSSPQSWHVKRCGMASGASPWYWASETLIANIFRAKSNVTRSKS